MSVKVTDVPPLNSVAGKPWIGLKRNHNFYTPIPFMQDCQQCRGPGALDSMVASVQEHVERLGDSAPASKVTSTSSLQPATLK